MKKKKGKGFTLVELLAVIVILAIILVIAVPQILKTINSSRLAAIKSSAELLLNQAEKQYMVDQALSANTGSDLSGVVYGGITTLASGANKRCTELTELNPNDYDTCKITVTNEGVATLNELTGKGKFKGYSCTGTKNNITCTGGESGGSGSNTNVDNGNYGYTYSGFDPSTYIVDLSSLVDDYTELNKSVFVKVNKTDASEVYVCTLYDPSNPNGLASEPACISGNAYQEYMNASDKTQTEWNNVIFSLFGSSNCNENAALACGDSYWSCYADLEDSYFFGPDGTSCYVYSFGGAYCSG